MIRGLVRNLIRDGRGVAYLEFALCAPLMLIMVDGTAEVTRYVRTRAVFYAATNAITDLVAEQSGVTSGTSGTMYDFCKGANYTLTGYPTGNLGVAIASVTHYASGIVRDWEYDSACPTAGTNIGNAAAVTLGTPMVPSVGDSVIIVQSSFAYVPYLTGIVASNTFKLTKYARPRYAGSSSNPSPVLCTVAGGSGAACPTVN